MTAPGPPLRVLVAEDQKVVRDGLVLLLGMLPGIEVAGAAVDGDDAVRQALELEPDVVLMDLHMPGCDGIEATRRLVRAQPGVHIVVLTSYSDDESVLAALRAGARGFLTKDAGAADILQAVLAVSEGKALLDPGIQRRLVEAILSDEMPERPGPGGKMPERPGPGTGRADAWPNGAGAWPDGFRPAGAAPGAGAPPDSAGPGGLTRREAEVLAEIAAGLSNGEIAAKLFISDTTVKTHVNHLLVKTGMRDRAQLVAYAYRLGLAR
jgi:DNA-binding NarL/FixJ family response regulator